MTSVRKIKKRANRLASYNQPYVQQDVMMEKVEPLVEQAKNEAIQEFIEITTPRMEPKPVTIEKPLDSVSQRSIEDANKLQEESLDVDKNLLKAVEKLTSSMDFRAKEEKKGGISNFFESKIGDVKQMFTIPGIAQAMGIGQDPSTLIGSILKGYTDSMQEKESMQQEKASYIADFSTLTEAGRGMSKTEAFKEGSRRFDELKKLEPELAALENKEKRAKQFGGSLSESDLERKSELEEKRKQLRTYTTETEPKKKTAPGLSEEKSKLLDDVQRGILDELGEMNAEEKNAFISADPELLKEMFKGAFAELVELNDDQLKELQSINDTLSNSEEELHEANLTEKQPIAKVIPEKQEDGRAEKDGSLIDSIKEKAGDLLSKRGGKLLSKGAGMAKGLGSGLMRVMPAVGKAALPAAAVAGAGYAGWKVGGWLNDNVINPAAEKMTGVKGQTLGGAIYDLLNPSPEAEKPVTPPRVSQKQQMNKVEQQLEQKSKETTEAKAPVVNNVADNRSTVVNNSTVMKIPVRNQEPALNRRLERMIG